MKYIVTKNETEVEEIFIFPESINHDAMAEALSCIKIKTTGDWRRVRRVPISAGFVIFGKCYGESMTLGLKSREKDNEFLLEIKA